MGSRTPHAVVIPYPAVGHINPMMQFSKKLASKGFIITFVNTEYNHVRILEAQKISETRQPREQGLDIRMVALPDGLPLDYNRTADFITLMQSVDGIQTLFEQLIESLNHDTPVTCIISDVTIPWGQSVANKFEIPRAAFWPTSIALYSLLEHVPFLKAAGDLPTNGIPSDISSIITSVPGFPKLHAKHLPWLLGSNEDHIQLYFEWWQGCWEQQRQITRGPKWVICNSFHELECRVIDAVPKRLGICPVGPLPLFDIIEGTKTNRTSFGLWPEETECLEWLDRQAPTSVLYVSFGSLTILNTMQLGELALGLECSRQPFLWVVRPDLMAGAAAVLPEGFLQRTKGQGLIISWAPQLLVLSHPSVGGFLTHCGWNSTIEGICTGVPMLTWPYFGDQFVNSQCMVEDWRVGLAVKMDDDGIVKREEVERVVRRLMQEQEGKEIKSRVGKLRDAARTALEEGGSSHATVEAFVKEMQGLAGLEEFKDLNEK